ncbi:MAG TPA: methylamine dehydrogenase (amicyanin) light chain, partial [Methylophaga sp.]|nr:methylamine dehydrogenase (amicyanin) light chain [Methylophaga sp.]
MKKNKGFDSTMEKLARGTASKTGRRGFIGKLGGFIVGAGLLPLLPVDRRGRMKEANATTTGTMDRSGFQPQDQDTQACDYWRHCSIDGNLCDC